MRFWDTSAILPLIVVESQSAKISELLKADRDIVVWWGTLVECESALARRHRDRGLSETEYTDARRVVTHLSNLWTVINPSGRVRESAARLVRVHPLRAADAFQLSAALVWSGQQPEGLELVSLNIRLAQAANLEGFAVLTETWL